MRGDKLLNEFMLCMGVGLAFIQGAIRTGLFFVRDIIKLWVVLDTGGCRVSLE